MVNFFRPDANLLGVVQPTKEERDALTVNLLSDQDDSYEDPRMDVSRAAIEDYRNYLLEQAQPPQDTVDLVPAGNVAPDTLQKLSYSAPQVENLPPPEALTSQQGLIGQEPLPQTEDPWYSRIMGTVNNILNLGKEKLERNPTVLNDWANQFAASPFLAMARNETFDRMREQANANLNREAKMGRTGSEAAPLQIYKHFLGENGYGNPDNTPEQNQLLAQDAYAKTMAFLQSSRSNINIGGEPNDKWVNDINKKTYEDVNSAASASYFLRSMANDLIGALEKGDLTTGGGDIGSWGLGTLNKLGLSSEKQQRYSALLSRFSMEQRKALLSSFKGAISTKEQANITGSIAGLGSSRAENLAFLKLASLSARLAQDAQKKFDELMGMGLTGAALSTAYNNYLDSRSNSTDKEVASIMGGVSGRRGSQTKGGSVEALNMDELE